MHSFGHYPSAHPLKVLQPAWRDEILSMKTQAVISLLPIGLRRSYGDSCLNNGGSVIEMTRLNKVLLFNKEQGTIVCEGGMSFRELLSIIVPHGLFPPVTPGTQFVTVAGAIANDVHGKNHHAAGSFGNHVLALGLLRTDSDEVLYCSEDSNAELFHATIGGLGLTGIILWAEFSLSLIPSLAIASRTEQFVGFDMYTAIAQREEQISPNTVAWFDCFSAGISTLKGLYTSGDFTKDVIVKGPKRTMNIPCNLPDFILNRISISLFNALYYRKNGTSVKNFHQHYESFFYPLDAIRNWNRCYGKNGFLQYQCVLPHEHGKDVLQEMLKLMNTSNLGSFLVVLKTFGEIRSKGLLSFPMPGMTVAMDFPMKGEQTLKLLDQFDVLTNQVGGRVYPAKDARMSGEHFRQWYPRYIDMQKLKDPGIQSTFWQRMMQ